MKNTVDFEKKSYKKLYKTLTKMNKEIKIRP